MTDIPADIRKTVDRVIADLKGRADSIEEDAEAVLADAFSRAILAERERCFQITEDQYDEAPTVPFDNGGTSDGWHMACTRIGKLIKGEA